MAKKRFYTAYELTQGRKFDKEKKREGMEIYKEELKKECGTCEERDTCNTPCPDVLPFLDQDHIKPTYAKTYEPDRKVKTNDLDQNEEDCCSS